VTRKADRIAAITAPVTASPRFEACHDAANFELPFVRECRQDTGRASDEFAKMPRSGGLRSLRGRFEAGPAARARPWSPRFPAASLRVKKSLPDRGGCSMINNLPKLMDESATRGRFQDENFKLLSVAHGDMECRNIVPLGRITTVIHLRDGGRSQVFTCRLRKSAIPVNCWSLRTNSSIKKQS